MLEVEEEEEGKLQSGGAGCQLQLAAEPEEYSKSLLVTTLGLLGSMVVSTLLFKNK